MKINITTKICKACGKELPISEFSPNGQNGDGYMYVCKECTKARRHKDDWKQKNMAIDKFPWPFDASEHEMDIEAIRNHTYDED